MSKSFSKKRIVKREAKEAALVEDSSNKIADEKTWISDKNSTRLKKVLRHPRSAKGL
jgi:hypothetical protein